MADKVDVKTLGHSGVIIDQNTLEPTVPDDALHSAQNASHDPTQGLGGALRKRPGLKRFNYAYSGGAILGGIPMAVAGTGGAPPSGGGGTTGDPTGAGPGTGAPGGTTDGSTPTVPPAGGGSFTGGTPLFGGARLVVIGRDDSTTSEGSGWFVTSKKIANAAQSATVPGPPGKVYSFPPTTSFPTAFGRPMVWHDASGYLFYAVQHVNQLAGGAITIRKTNGGSDVGVCTVPLSGNNSACVNFPSDKTVRAAVITMHLGTDGLIYVGVKEKASGQATTGNWGSIFKLDPTSGNTSEVFISTSSIGTAGNATIPYCIAQFQNSVYWGEHNLNASSDTQKDTNAVINAMSTDGSTCVIEHAFSDAEIVSAMYPFPQTAPASNPLMDLAANRNLFCAFGVNKTVPTYAFIYSRNRSALQTPGAYTVQKQGLGGSGAVNGNYWVSMVAFNDKLYASYYNPSQIMKIFQFAPNYANLAADGGWDGSGTWTEVFSNASPLALHLFVDDGVMYAFGGAFGSGSKALWTTDGASFTDVTTNLPDFGNGSFPMPILAGFNQ